MPALFGALVFHFKHVVGTPFGDLGEFERSKRPRKMPMDFTGRPMKGMVYVESAGFASPGDLKAWIRKAMAFALSLPAK